MRIGPRIQFCSSDSSMTRRFCNTFPISSYRTLARGGYIMTIKPIAMGMEVVPTDIPLSQSENAGRKVSQANSDCHGQENPNRKIPIHH